MQSQRSFYHSYCLWKLVLKIGPMLYLGIVKRVKIENPQNFFSTTNKKTQSKICFSENLKYSEHKHVIIHCGSTALPLVTVYTL